MMKLIRKIHPVGLSLFVTEKFERDGKAVFIVVYDCGKTHKSVAPKSFEKQIDSEFMSLNKKIDLLFLSHFDNDHINGLSYITSNYCDKKTTIVIPLIRKRHFELYQYITGSTYSSCVLFLYTKEIPLVFIEPENIGDNKSEDYDKSDFVDDPTDSIISRSKILGCGPLLPTIIGPIKQFWQYIPFHMQDDRIYDEFLKNISPDIDSKNLNDFKNWTAENKDKLKKKYNGFKYYYKKSNPTSINANSLLMISKKADGVKDIIAPLSANSFNGHVPNYINMPSSVIYTADSDLQVPQFFNKLKNYVNNYCADGIGLFQIPHHGSIHCYNKNIFTLKPTAVFCNCKYRSSNPAYEKQIDNDAKTNGCPYYIVDDKYELREEIELT